MNTTQGATMNRSDTHKPSLLDPSEYRFMAAFYQGSSDEMHDSYRHDHEEYEAALANYPVFEGNHERKTTCDHCGAAFAHGALFLHIPSETLIHVGHICASNTVGLPSKAVAARKRAERQSKEAKIRKERIEAFAAAGYTDVVEYLNRKNAEQAAYGDAMQAWNEQGCTGPAPKAPNLHNFIRDMIHNLNRWGSLFPKQAEAVRKFIANDAKFEERRAEREAQDALDAPTTPLAEGRRPITGTIISTKWQDSDFGSTPKMLVKEDDGNKVWGTVAESLFNEGHDLAGMKGLRVEFTATVERSRDDEHFGFFKRPSGATIDNAKEVAN